MLLISPVTCTVGIIIIAVYMVVLTLLRLLFDWLIMPISGKHVESPTTREYWKGFFVPTDKRICHYVEFQYRSYWIGITAILAVIAWISFGGFGFYSLSSTSERDKGLVIIILSMWSVITLVVLGCILKFSLEDSQKWHDLKEGAGLITGKLCRRLRYEAPESSTDD
jgi:uncharacterized membrane protein